LVARDHFGDLGEDENIILKWILKKCMRVRTGFIWLTIEPVAVSCEEGIELSGSI
jgi:hypothetical protein